MVAVNVPMVAPVNVADVLAISIGEVNAGLDDFCHVATVLVFVIKFRLCGDVTLHIV